MSHAGHKKVFGGALSVLVPCKIRKTWVWEKYWKALKARQKRLPGTQVIPEADAFQLLAYGVQRMSKGCTLQEALKQVTDLNWREYVGAAGEAAKPVLGRDLYEAQRQKTLREFKRYRKPQGAFNRPI